jgi:hypothetical protein
MRLQVAWCVFVGLVGCGGSIGSPVDAGAGGTGGAGGAAGMAGAGFGPVQCASTDDCPSVEQPPTAGGCFVSRPGGVCTHCDIRMACPAGTQCIADPVDTMVCAHPCTGDASCNLGMFCNPAGFCAQRPCAANGTCPAPYACVSGVCVRPRCDGDAGTCPAPLSCGVAGFCVEPI